MNLDRKAIVKPTFTARQWQLYDIDGSDAAAGTLNSVLASAVNTGCNRAQVLDKMRAAMRLLSSFGAQDTEPLGLLDEILNEIFGAE